MFTLNLGFSFKAEFVFYPVVLSKTLSIILATIYYPLHFMHKTSTFYLHVSSPSLSQTAVETLRNLFITSRSLQQLPFGFPSTRRQNDTQKPVACPFTHTRFREHHHHPASAPPPPPSSPPGYPSHLPPCLAVKQKQKRAHTHHPSPVTGL